MLPASLENCEEPLARPKWNSAAAEKRLQRKAEKREFQWFRKPDRHPVSITHQDRREMTSTTFRKSSGDLTSERRPRQFDLTAMLKAQAWG